MPFMRGITCIFFSFICFNAQAIAPSDVTPSSFEKATRELTSYCIESVCLGMTIPEISNLGSIEWNPTLPADGKLACHTTLGNSATAYLWAKEKGFMLTFDLVSTTGKPEERYRLNSITLLQPPPTEALVTALLERLNSKLGPMKEILGKGLWTAYQNKFAITAGKAPSDGMLPERLLLLATYRARTDWVMNLPECKARLAKP